LDKLLLQAVEGKRRVLGGRLGSCFEQHSQFVSFSEI